MDIFGIFDQVERVLAIYFTICPLRNASGVIGKYSKSPLENMRVVSAWVSIVHWCVLSIVSDVSAQMAGVAHTIHCDSSRALGSVARSAIKGRIYYDFT